MEKIEQAWVEPSKVTDYKEEILLALEKINTGEISVVDSKNWEINEAAKKAILLGFKIFNTSIMGNEEFTFYDKFPSKFKNWKEEDFANAKIRVVPNVFVRYTAHIGENVVLMPCFVNVGAVVKENTMIDSFATVGSCSYVGAHCHISAGVTIGGVLEPLVAKPVIIEDNCFIGANSSITEGVHIEQGSVIASGVHISSSVAIYNSLSEEVIYGRIPSGSVVVPGVIPGTNKIGPIIIKKVTEETRKKTSINQILRGSDDT